jgi:prophage regulatory protein
VADRLLNLREVCRTVCLGRSAIYAAMKAGTFPKSRKASAAKVAWLESEIQAWIAALPVSGDLA